MGGLREGGAVLKKRPLAAIGGPKPTVDRLVGEPGAGCLGVLSQPEGEVSLLPGRLGVQPAGKPKEVVGAGEE
eukprot:9572315-Alexandrium_andersonii.AAC.1